MQAGSIPSNFLWTLSGYAVYAGCQWGLLVALAKLGTTAMVGQFALGMAITAPLAMFTNLQLRSVLATDTRAEYAFADYLGLRSFSTLVSLMALAPIAWAGGADRTTFAVIALAGVAKGIESMSDIYFGLRQQHEQMQPIARSLAAKGMLSLAAFWLALRLTHSLIWAMAALAAAWATVLVIYDARAIELLERGEAFKPRWAAETMKKLAWRSLPLGIMAMLVSMNANIPRYFIEGHLGAAALGIFAALLYPMTAGTLVVTALGQAALPVLARQFAAGERIGEAFVRLVAAMSAGGLLLGAAGVLLCLAFGRPLLTAFYRTEYAAHSDVLVWLAVAATLNYAATFLNAGVTATRHFHVLTVPYLLQAIFAAAVSAALVAHAGLPGAAWASCAISAAGCVIPLGILLLIYKRGNTQRVYGPEPA
jgi:O-antigen/teichoic acid export membrane protein